LCPFSDDEAIGMGGTIAKYVKEGKNVIKVVYSPGEKSIPHFQEDVVKKQRYRETDKASRYIGIKENKNLGLKDTQLKSEIHRPFVAKRIKEMIEHYKPEKIYVPSILDPHPDHQAVNESVVAVIDTIKKHYLVYAFEVWNIVNETHPQVYIDITPYIKVKLEYIKMFKSQWHFMYTLYFPALLRSLYYGRYNNCRYAERFYKLR
jgi:N-acetylglucosamine malate deacetylase 1